MTGTDLKIWRRSLDITRAQLADALDVDQSTISRWENGKRQIMHPRAVKASLFLISRGYTPEFVDRYFEKGNVFRYSIYEGP